MDKSPDAFRTISEVADHLDTPAHVLRFWESRFPQVRPVKRAGGRRYYRPSDVALLAGIRHLLHEEGLTIRGVQKILREHGVRHVAGLVGAETAVAQAIEAEAIVLDRVAPMAPDLPQDTPSTGEDDGFADEWEDATPDEEITAAREAFAPLTLVSPSSTQHDDLPLFAAPRGDAGAATALPETQKMPLTGLRALRATKPPVETEPVKAAPIASAPVEAAPEAARPAQDSVTRPADPEEIDIATVVSCLRALKPGALAPHREAIAGLTERLEALRAAQGRPSRGSRG